MKLVRTSRIIAPAKSLFGNSDLGLTGDARFSGASRANNEPYPVPGCVSFGCRPWLQSWFAWSPDAVMSSAVRLAPGRLGGSNTALKMAFAAGRRTGRRQTCQPVSGEPTVNIHNRMSRSRGHRWAVVGSRNGSRRRTLAGDL